jgi:hypothetical protein
MGTRNETCYGFEFISKDHDATKVYTCSSGCVHLYNEYTDEIKSDCNFGQPYVDASTNSECFMFNSPEPDYQDTFYTVNICANGCVHATTSAGYDEAWCTTDDTFVDTSI